MSGYLKIGGFSSFVPAPTPLTPRPSINYICLAWERSKIEFNARLPSNTDQETWKVGIAPSLLETLQKQGHAVKQARILLVRDVFGDTREIFQGWSRPDTDDCFVYVGNPGHDYRGPTIEIPSPPNMIFLVFVLRDGTIDDWNWRPLKADDLTMPEGVNGRRIWPQT
jgi:hypothetical protein